MKLLTVDVGNSSISTGLFQDQQLIEEQHCATHSRAELKVLLEKYREHRSLDGISFCSVVPSRTVEILDHLQKYFSNSPFVVDSKSKFEISIFYDDPSQLGIDRIVNCEAAWRRFNGAAVVVDMGSATTVDCITSDGRFIGGAIAPGINRLADALHSESEQLPKVLLESIKFEIAQNTESAMKIGVWFGYLGLIERLLKESVRQLKDLEADSEIIVVATGGHCTFAAPDLEIFDVIDPTLTLHGLRHVWYNSQKQ